MLNSPQVQLCTTEKVRILHVIDSFSMGGLETWLRALLRYWHSQEADAPQLDFLAVGGQRGMFDEEVRALGGRIFYLRYDRAHLIPFIWGFRRLLREARYAAIHDHQGSASGWHFLLGMGRLPQVRVTHLHNPIFEIANRTPSRRVVSAMGMVLLSRLATHVLGTSRQLIEEYGFGAPRFRHIPQIALHCGFDTERFLGDPSAAKV